VLISFVGAAKKYTEARLEECGGCYSVVTLFFAKKALTKPTGVLEHCRERKTKCWLYIFRLFPSDHIPKATKDVNV
jgi:hypothetical protein